MQTPHQIAVAAGNKAILERAGDLRGGLMTPAQSNELGRTAYDAAFKAATEAEAKRKEALKDPNRPKPTTTVVFDPYNRLTSSTRETTPGGGKGTGVDYQQMMAPLERYMVQPGSGSNLSPRGPITTVNQLPAHTIEYNAFKSQVACMDKGSLQALQSNLYSHISTLQKQPASAKRNVEIGTLRRQINLILGQLKYPQPCPSGGLVTSFPGAGSSAPVNKPDFPSGGSVSTPRQYGPGYYAADYRAPAEQVSIDAPAADLYSEYAIRAETRELDRLTRQMESLNALPRAVSEVQEATPQAAAPSSFPGFASGPVYGVSSDEAFLKADADSRALEQSAIPASTEAEGAVEEKPKSWLWIAGAAILAMLA